MMNVGEMPMRMLQRFMKVRMGVRRGRVNARRVRVPVMFVVGVAVRMLQRFMRVLVFVPLRQMQPDTEAHECSGCDK